LALITLTAEKTTVFSASSLSSNITVTISEWYWLHQPTEWWPGWVG